MQGNFIFLLNTYLTRLHDIIIKIVLKKEIITFIKITW